MAWLYAACRCCLHLLFSIIFTAGGALPVVFRFTVILALPAWCLYLPMLVILKNAGERRGRLILLSATLISPASGVFWCLLVQLRGGDPEREFGKATSSSA